MPDPLPDHLSALRVYQFTEELMSKAPTPGGGGTAALIGSLAASLAAMATNLTIGKKKFLPFEQDHLSIIAETNMLRLRLLELMDEDAAAFAPLSRVYALDKDSPGYADQLETATLNACKAPCEMMDCSCKLISMHTGGPAREVQRSSALGCGLRRPRRLLRFGIRLHECLCKHADASWLYGSGSPEYEGPGHAGGISPPCPGCR